MAKKLCEKCLRFKIEYKSGNSGFKVCNCKVIIKPKN